MSEVLVNLGAVLFALSAVIGIIVGVLSVVYMFKKKERIMNKILLPTALTIGCLTVGVTGASFLGAISLAVA